MYKLLCALALTTPVLGHASDWYFINDRSPEGVTYFDKESHLVTNGSVTLWLQKVRMDNENRDDYSSKQKVKFTCKSRTFQLLNLINYDSKGTVTYSSTTVGNVKEAVPDSTGDYLMKIVCSKNFPNEKNTDNYFPVDNPIETTKKLKAELSKN